MFLGQVEVQDLVFRGLILGFGLLFGLGSLLLGYGYYHLRIWAYNVVAELVQSENRLKMLRGYVDAIEVRQAFGFATNNAEHTDQPHGNE